MIHGPTLKRHKVLLLSVYQDVLTVPDAWDGNFLDAATDNAMTRVYDSSVYRARTGRL